MSEAKKASAQDTPAEEVAEGLRGLGLTEYEIRVYLAIVRHPFSRIPEIAKHSTVPQPKVYATVKRLIGRGLCESHLGSVNTYSAVSPKEGFGPLLEGLQQQHFKATDVVQSLQKQFETPADPLAAREGRIKLFQGKHSTSRNFRFLLSKVERDVALMSEVPFVVTDDDDLIQEAIDRGARVRILVGMPDDFDIRAEPFFERQTALGCESRRLSNVPMRMAVFDEKVALMPIHESSQGKDVFMMLEVRNEGLAKGMCNVFEMLWAQASPIEAPEG